MPSSPHPLLSLSSFADGYFAVVDKPPGIITHELTSAVGRLFGLKAGHAGTLDPNVSGVLPIGLGRARKLLPFLTLGEKEYVALFHLPWARGLPREEVEKRLKAYEGEIVQRPPKRSAVRRRPRKRRIYRIELLEAEGAKVLLRALVERGTYMRVLAVQMGGSMLELRRTAVSAISEKDAVLTQQLQDSAALYPITKPCLRHPLWVLRKAHLGEVVVREGAVERILNGSPLFPPGVERVEEGKRPYYVLRSRDLFIGVAQRERKEGREVFQPIRIQPMPIPR